MNTSITQLLSDLYLLCQESETGTFFITTSENRSCQIVLKEGEIISSSYGKLMGDGVLSSIQSMQVERFSFKIGLVLPMPTGAKVSSSKEFLQELGNSKSEIIAGSEAKSNKPARMYRGQVVQDIVSGVPESTPAPEVKSKKPVRMYRGQVVQDIAPDEPESTPTPEVKSKKPVRMYRGQVVQS